jgi:ribokinase
MRILSVGDINVDVILRSRFPPRGKQVVIEDYQVHGGGCAANFALACAKLGTRVRLAGKVGRDHWGQFVLEELRRAGVDVTDVVISGETKTGITYAIVEETERSFITYRGGNVEFSIADISLKKIHGDVVHFPSFFLLENLRPHYSRLMETAKSKGALVSFDTGWDPFNQWRSTKYLLETLESADVFLPNLGEARMITGKLGAGPKELARRLLKMGPEVVCIKMGERGVVAADRKGLCRIPSFSVEVVDTTGAGDVFDAAFVIDYSNTGELSHAGKFASAAAAISITGPGWARYPEASEVREFIRNCGCL